MIGELNRFERGFEQWIRDFGFAMLQITLGAVYVWFGVLKLLAQDPTRSVERIAFYGVDLNRLMVGLGIWEVSIGVALLLPLLSLPKRLERICIRALFVFFLVEIGGTLVMMLFGTHRFFVPSIPYLSVVGEYLVRNLVFAVVGLVIAGNMRIAEKPNSNV